MGKWANSPNVHKEVSSTCAICGDKRISRSILTKYCKPCALKVYRQKNAEYHRLKRSPTPPKLSDTPPFTPRQFVLYALDLGMLSTLSIRMLNEAGITDIAACCLYYPDFIYPDKGPMEKDYVPEKNDWAMKGNR